MQLLRVILSVLLPAKVFCTAVSTHPILLVISFDGFRYDYFNKGITPTLDALKGEGTRSDYLKNVFPTKTFPNHHSIATGLFPESHGVLGNSIYDTKKKKVYNYSAHLYNNPDVTPIWTLNQQARNGRYSGTMMWPGGEFEYKSVNPTFSQPLDFSVTWEARVDSVIEWLTHKKTPANLVMMYFEEPDRRSHAFGPESDAVMTHIEKLDNITRYLRDQLSSKGILEKINVIQLSDHGMESVTLQRIINVTDLIDAKDYKLVDTSPVFQIFPESGKEDAIYRKLKTASTRSNFKVYRKSEIPDRWHYKGSARSPPILLVANEGYAFDDIYLAEEEFIRTWNVTPSQDMVFGLHGYDNSEVNMRPFFFAWGPKVKKNHVVDPFNTVDLYSLFSKILNLQPPKNNGTFTTVNSIVQSRSKL